MATLRRILLSVAVVFAFAAVVSVLPLPIAHGGPHPAAVPQNPPPRLVGKPLMMTGTISSVQQYAFVLDVTKPKKDSIPFFTYSDTAVEGDMKVGAKADVTYQKDDQGNFVATKVHINS